MGHPVNGERGSILDHLNAARMALETADTEHALEHIRAATRLLGSLPGLCDATHAVAPELGGDVRHYRHSPSRSFTHVCSGIEGHDAAHLCSCGYTWLDPFTSWSALT